MIALISKAPYPFLILLAVLSFLPTLFFYMTGEEGIYVTSTLEMWHQGTWLQQVMYGQDNSRPPLLNWFTMPLSALLGWQNALVGLRVVCVAATLGSAGWLYWLSAKLYADQRFALFAALTFLSLADLLLYRGWLGYTDPLFSFFTFGALATLWIASIERSHSWQLLSVLLLSCAMLTKAFTAYVFYGTLALILLLQQDTRSFFRSPLSWLIFVLALIVPIAWFSTVSHGGNSSFMLNEILRKLSAQGLAAYLQHLVEYPLELAARLSPPLLLAAYLLLRKRITENEAAPEHFRSAVLFAILALIPYWLSPQSSVRYLLPIYPFIALVCARIIWRAGSLGHELALRWFAVVIAAKFLLALVLFPYYQTHYRGENYKQAAHAIIERTQGFPLFISDVRATGLSVAGYIDMARFPQTPVVLPPSDFDSGFVLSMENDPVTGTLVETYSLAAERLYLLCRGAACGIRH